MKQVLIIGLTVVLAGCSQKNQHDWVQRHTTPAIGVSGDFVSLDQGWDNRTKAAFRSTGQGSLILPYIWFVHLEQADKVELFRSKQNIERFYYIPQVPATWNPDGMPLGFVKSFNPETSSHWVGLNCAACHTAQINYQGTSMLVDGAPTMGDFQSFIQELENALVSTLADEQKFDRFARKVLADGYDDSSYQDLKTSLSTVTEQRKYNNRINTTTSRYGYGRLDAFGITFNNVAVQFLGIPENQIDPNAPASYPFIWGALQSDYMQWVATAPNTPIIGSILRATGEVWGTFGYVKINPSINPPGYESSAPFEDIEKLLGWVKDLRSPKWPDGIFPRIDSDMAEKGRTHYQKNCINCHQVINRNQQKDDYKAVLVPYNEVGTDPTEVEMVGTNTSKTGVLEGTPIAVAFGSEIGPTTTTGSLLFNASLGAMMRHPEKAMRNALKTQMGQYVKSRQTSLVYKARPLTGIWATAPFLHNGSVANLYQLLLPADRRDPIIYVGNRDFDPKNVGFVAAPSNHTFALDTRLPGNLNTGHEYGTNELTEMQRWELVEYLKTL